ncbi:two-component regulator propeller domain-containing protein [Flavobacteriaceae bacterium M23B6Z8]
MKALEIKSKLFIVVTLLLTLCSCKGQQEEREVTLPADSEKKSEQQKSKITDNKQPLFYPGFDGQMSQVIRTMFQDSEGNLWFGTQNGAFKFEDNTLIHIDGITSETMDDVTIKDITQSKDGKIWLAHTDGVSSIDGNTITNYSESNGLLNNDVWSVVADRTGKIWIATIDGVCVFNGEEFIEFYLPEGKIDTTVGFSSKKMVHNIFEDSKGTLWFSSNAGLFSYANDTLMNISQQRGIPTNFVNEVFEDTKGGLWVSTKAGLYNLTENNTVHITEEKIENGKGIGNIAEDKDGKIWFVSNQHYLYTYDGEHLKEIEKSEENERPVIFKIFKDKDDRLWFVGYGGAFRWEDGKFISVTKNGPW